MRGDVTELAIEVNVRKDDLFFQEQIDKLEKVKDITLIQYSGEYNG